MNILEDTFQFLIQFIFSLSGDFGVSIILLTLMAKILISPFSIKQKISMKKQMLLSKEVENIKNIYKNNKKKLDSELTNLYSKNSSSIVGMFALFLQLPVISGLYMTINNLPLESMTFLVPWCINLGSSDSTLIIPIIYCIVSVLPSLLSYFKAFSTDDVKTNIKTMIPLIIFSFVIAFKAPVGLGIYFITSSLYSLIEDILFKLYYRNKTYSLNM